MAGLTDLNPRTKLAALLWAASFIILLPAGASWGFAATLLLAAIVVRSTFGLCLLRRSLELTLPFTLAVVLVQTLFLKHPDSRPFWGPILYSDAGLAHGLLLAGRVTAVVVVSLAIVLTTPPAKLLLSLDAAGWPPAVAFLIASPLLILDSFTARIRSIREAQQTRGWRLGGSPWHRLRGVFLLVSPLITSALIEADYRSHILAQRGFRAHRTRTTFQPVADGKQQGLIRKLLIGLSVFQTGLALWGLFPSKI